MGGELGDRKRAGGVRVAGWGEGGGGREKLSSPSSAFLALPPPFASFPGMGAINNDNARDQKFALQRRQRWTRTQRRSKV